jgi:hypothetical protein
MLIQFVFMGERYQSRGGEIKIEKDLMDLITPLTKEEFSLLQSNILTEGCRDPLIVWAKDKEKLTLIDGHNRYNICSKHNKSFSIKKLEFKNLEEVKLWMLNNQLGRRNLNPEQLSYYRGLKYLGLRRKQGGFDNVKSKGQNEPSTAQSLSKEFNVSESTIKRDAKFTEALEIIARSNPQLKNDILSGQEKFKKNDIVILTQTQDKNLLNFKNSADLHNKLNIIRDYVLNDLETTLSGIEENRIAESKKILQEKEPIFLDKEERIRTLKGRIISVINKAIKDKDINSIVELKGLIEKLELVLFD